MLALFFNTAALSGRFGGAVLAGLLRLAFGICFPRGFLGSDPIKGLDLKGLFATNRFRLTHDLLLLTSTGGAPLAPRLFDYINN